MRKSTIIIEIETPNYTAEDHLQRQIRDAAMLILEHAAMYTGENSSAFKGDLSFARGWVSEGTEITEIVFLKGT